MSNPSQLLRRWSAPLSELGEGGHLARVVDLLNPMYSDDKLVILPEKNKVFQAFRMLEPEELRVVILGMDPYPTPGEATGYAFANPEETLKMSKSLAKIHETLEEDLYDGLYLDFDVTLQHWADQGVLAVNSAFTVEKSKPGSHRYIWDVFTRTLMGELSRNFDGLYFCFWGKQAQMHSFIVNRMKHKVMFAYHPAYAVRQGKKWECDHFSVINEGLKNDPIKW